MFVVSSGKKQRKHVGKMPETWKKFDSEVITTFFKKNSAKFTNFEVSRLGLSLELQVSSLGLGVFDEVSVESRNSNQVTVSKVTSL